MEVPKHIYHVIRAWQNNHNGDGEELVEVRSSHWTLKDAKEAVKTDLKGIRVHKQKFCRQGEGEEDVDEEEDDPNGDGSGYDTDMELYAEVGEGEVTRVYMEKKPAPRMPFLKATPPSMPSRPSKVYVIHQNVKLYHDMEETESTIVGSCAYDTIQAANEATFEYLNRGGRDTDDYAYDELSEERGGYLRTHESNENNRGSATNPYDGRIYHLEGFGDRDMIDTLEVCVKEMYMEYAESERERKKRVRDDIPREVKMIKKVRKAGADGVVDLTSSSP